MKKLLQAIERLKKSRVKRLVDSRIKEFEALGKKSSSEIFSELCFCILTANFNAEKSIRIQREIGSCFAGMPEKKLAAKLKEFGHRYPNTRAKYIAEARACGGSLKRRLESLGGEKEAREWLVKNVKGLGYKEASHFLRNIGYRNLAIIDFHIADLLERYGLYNKPKTITKKKYLEMEEVLEKVAAKAGMGLAELDLYLWHMETGKVLK